MTFSARFNPSKLLSQWSRGFCEMTLSKINSLVSQSVAVSTSPYRITYDKDHFDSTGYKICRTCKMEFDKNGSNNASFNQNCPYQKVFDCKMVYVVGPNDDLEASPFQEDDRLTIRKLVRHIELKIQGK